MVGKIVRGKECSFAPILLSSHLREADLWPYLVKSSESKVELLNRDCLEETLAIQA